MEDERNTKFYHTKTINRRQKNKIRKLRNGDGDWIENEDILKDHVGFSFQASLQGGLGL